MNFYKNVVLIFALFPLVSCERSYVSSIVNNSKNEITVKVKMDIEAINKRRKEYLEKKWLYFKEIP